MKKKDLLLDDFLSESFDIQDAGRKIEGGGTILHADGTDNYISSQETEVTDDCGDDTTTITWDGDGPWANYATGGSSTAAGNTAD